jgi:hypothetical protein
VIILRKLTEVSIDWKGYHGERLDVVDSVRVVPFLFA